MNTPQRAVVRLSLRWIFLIAVTLFLIGILGGILGASLNPPQMPLIPQRDQLVTTVQEVTISPNESLQENVADHERSVLLLAHGNRNNPTIFAAASVVTNDGLLASVHQPIRDEVFGIDTSGTYVALESVGPDALYGITFYRVRDGVFAPLDLETSDPTPGALLLELSRSPETLEAFVHQKNVTQYTPPAETSPDGWLRLARITTEEPTLPGSPLITDDGSIAGITVLPTGEQAIPVSYLKRSIERLSSGQRESNPFETVGLTVAPSFAPRSDQSGIEFQFVVTSVEPNSAASALRTGDIIKSINEQELAWEANIADLISANESVTITIERSGREQTIPLAKPATTPKP